MNNLEKIKNNLIEKYVKEIVINTNKLNNIKIEDKEYLVLITKISKLRNYIEIIKNINIYNYKIKLKNMENSIKNYYFLRELSSGDNLEDFIDILEQYREKDYFEYNGSLLFSDNLRSLEYELNSLNIDFRNIKDLNIIESIVNVINKHRKKVIDSISELNSIMGPSVFYKIDKIKLKIDQDCILTDEELSQFNIDESNLLEQIVSNKKELIELEKKSYFNKNEINRLKTHIVLLEKRLISNIEDILDRIAISNNLKIINGTISSKYNYFNSKLLEFRNGYDNLLSQLKIIKKTISSLQRNINLDFYKFNIDMSFDNLSELSRENIYDIIMQIEIYEEIKKYNSEISYSSNIRLGGL